MLSFQLFHEYEQFRWSLADIPWSRIARENVKAEYIGFTRAAVMGECNSVAALHGFLNESLEDYDFATYASLWSSQELLHHFAFRTYLEKLGETIPAAQIEATRAPYPPGVTHAATLATNIISELTACHAYHAMARSVEEPVLREILERASQDEARHARAFLHYTRRRLDRYPRELQSILEIFYVYIGDPSENIKHPVSVFKGKLAESHDGASVDAGLAYFQTLESNNRAKLRQKLFQTLSTLTGRTMGNLASIRRALAET